VAGEAVEQFIYILGEAQNGMIPESADVLAFTREQMQQVETGELEMVIANVFGRGQSFFGPDEAITAVIHEFIRRSDRFRLAKARKKHHCTLVSALKRFDGEYSVKVVAVIAVPPGTLKIQEPQSFYQMVVNTLPEYQEVFLEEAYAKDSKLIELIQETTLYHINASLH